VDSLFSSVLVAFVGGVLAIAGAFAASWFQARITMRTRMNEVLAERKVTANADAYVYLKTIESRLAERNDAEALSLLMDQENWLMANRLFLPAAFTETWQALRQTLRWLADTSAAGDSETLRRLRLQALKFVKEAMRQVYRDMDVGGKTDNGIPA
jgi:hypothetical protein